MFDIKNETKIKEYINNYLAELQRHFDISDNTMRNILYKVYKDSTPVSKFYNAIKKHMSMVKSFYIKNIKRNKPCK